MSRSLAEKADQPSPAVRILGHVRPFTKNHFQRDGRNRAPDRTGAREGLSSGFGMIACLLTVDRIFQLGLRTAGLFMLACVCLSNGLTAPARILVFSKTAGFRHASIPNGLAAIQQLALENNFLVTATEDATAFTDANLAQYDAVVFLMTTGDVLDATQQGAFERYIRAGHGYAGVHSASDTEYSWPWYGGLVGAWFSNHPAIQTATIRVEDHGHASTSFLPRDWVRNDEWYSFRTNPRTSVRVLATLDESTYSGGTMGADHPIAWYHAYDGGRAWYTAGGHTDASYTEPLFRAHLLGGIRYAAGILAAPPPDALVLFDGRDTAQWVQQNGAIPVPWLNANGVLTVQPGSGSIRTFQTFQDYQLHLEFRVPPSPPGTAEGSLGNSGVFLQNQFEIQIIDSYNRPIGGLNDGGAIWSVRDATTNASLPTGTWETYDLTFRAARWTENLKTENARVTVRWNGVLVQDDVEIPRPTPDGAPPEQPPPGSIALQDLVGAVQFRNIWVLPTGTPRPPAPTNLAAVADGSQVTLTWAANAGATSYNVKRATTSDGPFTLLAGALQSARYVDAQVTNGVTYHYVVSALTSGVESLNSISVSVVARGSSPVPITFVAEGSSWKYLDDGSNQGSAWRATNFNDSAWPAGLAQFGYGDGGEATVIRSNRADGTRIITTYFRKSFIVTNVWAVTDLTLRLLRDDGGIVYLNGLEIFRSNMTNAAVTYTTPALVSVADAEESTFYPRSVSPLRLVKGTNLLAVEIHQNSTTSSDVSFDLSLSALAFGRPELNLARLGDQLILSWPVAPTGFHVETASDPGTDTIWLPLTNAPTMVITNQNVMTIESADEQGFYRLAR